MVPKTLLNFIIFFQNTTISNLKLMLHVVVMSL